LEAAVGGSLAVAGASYQSLLRNPLAEPYLLGISNGAAVGTMIALVFMGAHEWSQADKQPASATSAPENASSGRLHSCAPMKTSAIMVPTAAPLDIPRRYGSASGLRNSD